MFKYNFFIFSQRILIYLKHKLIKQRKRQMNILEKLILKVDLGNKR